MDVPILKPNIKKVFIYNILRILFATVIIIGISIFYSYFVGFDVFVPIFETFGVTFEIDTTMVLWGFVGAILVATVVILIVNYLILANVRYEFYPEKIVKYKTAFFILINSEDTSYGNISRVSYYHSGWINWLLRTGTVNVELTGTKKDNLGMEFIDDPQKISQYIQKCIVLYKSRYYAEHAEDYRLGKIMGREQYY